MKYLMIVALCLMTVACGDDAPTAPSIGPAVAVTPNPAKVKAGAKKAPVEVGAPIGQ